MPDFFDRLIARGAQRPGGGTSAPGHRDAVTFARPRLPGPFERPAAEPSAPFLEVVDEGREVDPARPETPRVRPALGSLAGTRAPITPPPRFRDIATPQAPGSGATVPAEQPPVRPAPGRQAPLLPRATPYHVADAGTAVPDQASARVSRLAADRDQERATPAGLASSPSRQPIVQPSPQRVLVVPASVVRPAADDARTVQPPPPEPPAVTVRIGRIEVRDTSQDRRQHQTKQRARRAAPKTTLAAYLAAANAGQNGVSTGGAR
jgi:hypothetical protein